MARPRKKKADIAQGSLLSLAQEQKETNFQDIPEIPVEEQPYPLPDGWKWVRLEDIVSISKEKTDDFSDKTLRYIGLEHFEKDNGIIDSSTTEGIRSVKNIFYPGQILYGRLRPYLNKHDIASFKGVCSTDILVLKCKSIILNEFVNLFLNLDFFIEFAVSNSKGINLPRVSGSDILKIAFPITSYEKQQNIAKNIHLLFYKFNKIKEQLQEILNEFENRRATILHKAFSGELTETWRYANKIDRSSWKIKSISSICNNLTYGTAKKSNPSGTIAVLRMGNLQNGEINWEDLVFSDDKDDIEKFSLSKNDVLFNRTNSAKLVGKTSIYRGEYPAIYAGYLIKMDYKKDIITGEYLNYAMNTNKAKEYCNLVKSDGVNQSNISAKKLGNFTIPVPSLPEQEEIVRILDSLLAKEQQVRDTAKGLLEQIELLKKSILAKAFRGELC